MNSHQRRAAKRHPPKRKYSAWPIDDPSGRLDKNDVRRALDELARNPTLAGVPHAVVHGPGIMMVILTDGEEA